MTWDMTPLSEILSLIRNGKSIKQTKDQDGLPISRIETIANGSVDFEKVGYAGIGIDGNESWLLRSGDILFSHINSIPHLGKCALFDSGQPMIHGMNLLCFRASRIIDPKFLLYSLRSPFFKKQLANFIKPSVNQASVSIASLKTIKIPLPPLPEQKRIAAILDKADAIRRKRKAALDMADEFLRATFLDMFGDPVTNLRGWDVKPLKSIADVNRGKFTPRPRNDPQYYGGDIPFIQTGDVVNADTFVTGHTQTLNEKGLKVSRLFQAGTIAMTIAANIGETAILSYPMCFPDSVVGITPHKEGTALFLDYVLRYHKRYLLSQATETAQKNINLQNIRPLHVVQPPESEIHRFVLTAKALMRHKNKLDIEGADILFASLSQRAFRGDL